MINWGDIVLSEEWMGGSGNIGLIRFWAKKRLGNDNMLVEEACTYVLDELSKDDWARCKTFKGTRKAKPNTYLATLTINLIETFARDTFGRPQPNKWLKDKGDLWVQIWKMICLQRLETEEVVILLSEDYHRQPIREPQQLRKIIQAIKQKIPNCGKKNQSISYDSIETDMDVREDDNDLTANQAVNQTRHNDEFLVNNLQIIKHDCHQLLSELLILEENPSNSNKHYQSIPESMSFLALSDQQANNIMKQLKTELTIEQRLVIKLHYKQQLKFNVIADMMGVKSYQPKRILDKALQTVGAILIEHGVYFEQ